RLWGLEMFRLPWLHLPYSVRTGKTSLDHIYGMREFDYVAQHPDVAEVFNEGMLASTVAAAAAAVQAYDFTPFRTVMDVGGGIGTLAVGIVKATPNVRGVVFDLPYCQEGARQLFAAEGVSDLCEFVAGDFFAAIPA